MESPEAAWVDMLMSRLQELERAVDVLKTDNQELNRQLALRAPAFAPGFNVGEDFFFWSIVDHRLTIEDWARRFEGVFSDFTICVCAIGEFVEPEVPIMQLTGLVRRTRERSCAPVSQMLQKCFGDARRGFASVMPTRTGDVCEAVLVESSQRAHRSSRGEGVPNLQDILSWSRFTEYESELTSFLHSGHIISAIRDRHARIAVSRVRTYMTQW